MPEATLPSVDEIRQLPRWARVAFAARCARRVLPMFTKHWPDAPREHVEAVTRAVEFAGSAAHDDDDDFEFDAPYADAADAAVAARNAAADARSAADAADYAAAAARSAATAGIAIPSIRADFQRVLDASRRGKWTDSTPVPPSVFGPLAAIEEPATSPEPVAEPSAFPKSKLEIDCYVGDLADHVEVGSRITDLFRELNEYSLRKWGKGLSIDDFEQLVLAKVPAGVKR